MDTHSDPPRWCDPTGLRIWRSPDSDFLRDEVGEASAVYTDEVIRGIADAGFNAIWMRARLRSMMTSKVLPDLNVADAAARRQSVRDVIERGQRQGVAVFLFFNEPLAVAESDPFWKSHPDLAGQTHRDMGEDHDSVALCTSHPEVQRFLRDAIDSVLRSLPGLGGVILITATEFFTHCWSHRSRYDLDDGVDHHTKRPFTCDRCAPREPADIVGELVTIWRDVAAALPSPPRILCWNWSWSQWYPDPQREVFARLPDGIEMLLDFERGTRARRRGRDLPIDEYALSVVGPSERFLSAKPLAAARGFPVHAKMQLGTTHEIATVPNLPLLYQIHGKLKQLTRMRVVGIMGTWNFGCDLTLNTAAVKRYVQHPEKYEDADLFLADLASHYLGIEQPADLLAGWRAFGEAFSHYPFSIRFLYFSPLNEAPAYPLAPRYEDAPMGGSWMAHDYGDRLNDTLTPGFNADECADAFDALANRWEEGCDMVGRALRGARGDAVQRQHREQEWSCARMIGTQMQCTADIYRFHAWRERRIAALALQPPCDVPLDGPGIAILRAALAPTRQALELCRADARLGVHQECHLPFYNVAMIERKLKLIEASLASVTAATSPTPISA